MDDTPRRAGALLLAAGFFMMIIGPIASLAAWIIGLVMALLFVPGILLMAMALTRRRAEEIAGDSDMLEPRGLTEDEWAERRDPDDFEGEID